MKKYKSWIKYFAGSLLLTTLIFIGINYYADYYKVFGNNLDKIIREPNQNVAKINYILKHPDKYDSFIFGSSRVGFIDPELFKDGKYYNFTYAEGLPQEHLNNIKLLLSRKIKIKNIIVGLDEFSYKLSTREHYKDMLKTSHPDASGQNKFIFYAKYLFLKPHKINKSHFKPIIYDIQNTGMTLYPSKEGEILTNIKAHVDDTGFNNPLIYKEDFIPESLDAVRQIVKLCKENNIKLIVFINPIHKTTYLSLDLNNFNRFKSELANITGYYDFSGVNEVTSNNLMFYETCHYRPVLGEIIADTIVNHKKNTSFEHYVTKKEK